MCRARPLSVSPVSFLLRARYGASQMDRNLSFQRCARIFLQCSAPARWFKLNPLRPPSSDSCFALLRERMGKVVFIAKRWPVSCLKGCNGYCAGLMIVLVSFIFAKSSEWRNFTTELNLAGFLSSRASLLNIYIFTVDENRKGPGIVTWIIVYI